VTLASNRPSLPKLGVGISAEPGSAERGIDACTFVEQHPELVRFVEYGSDVERGLDEHVRRWAAAGRATTYHFLDVNLEDPDDADEAWCAHTASAAREIGAAWLCGDAGLWHFGRRERGHQLLLPPVLTRESAAAVAASVQHIEAATGFCVLPENPPGTCFLGALHVLDYFAEVSSRSGCGLLLDCAHLAMFQRLRGHDPLTALDGFPLERVVELHVAGGTLVDVDGLELVDDTHAAEPLADTWRIFEHVIASGRLRALKAIVYECERNTTREVLANFRRLQQAWPS
jgi:uncharacterized protein (UPF0276 family)